MSSRNLPVMCPQLGTPTMNDGYMQLHIPTITITLDVLDFLVYEGPLKSKPGQGKKLRAGMVRCLLKKMITEVLLIIPLYLVLFFIWWQFQHVIKAMADVENVLNGRGFFGDIADTPKGGIDQHRKQECLKNA